MLWFAKRDFLRVCGSPLLAPKQKRKEGLRARTLFCLACAGHLNPVCPEQLGLDLGTSTEPPREKCQVTRRLFN